MKTSNVKNAVKEAERILNEYFWSLKVLVNIVVNSEPREATKEEINYYKQYMSLVSDIIYINQKMIVINMIIKGFRKKEIISRMGYKEEFDFDGLLNYTKEV